VISLNYEYVAENHLTTFGPSWAIWPTENRKVYAKSLDGGQKLIPVIKPHGSIAVSFTNMLTTNLQGTNQISIYDCKYDDPAYGEYPPVVPPAFPDLVPPGHSGNHLANCKTDIGQAIRLALDACNLLVVCGVSAAEPDFAELSGYFHTLNSRQKCVYAGIRTPDYSDETSNMSRILKASGADYSFVDQNEVENIIDLAAAI
jgi:hypothetical protein